MPGRNAYLDGLLGRLDDRFHETGLSGTGSLLVESSFAIGWTRLV
jgi:hypothetical protein